MPQAGSIAIADGQSTPVNHTFTPKKLQDGILAYFEEASGIPAARLNLTVSVRPPVGTGQMYRATVSFAVPAVAVVNGIQTVDHTNRVNMEFLVHQNSTDAEMKNLFAFAKNGLGNSQIAEAVTTLSPFY